MAQKEAAPSRFAAVASSCSTPVLVMCRGVLKFGCALLAVALAVIALFAVNAGVRELVRQSGREDVDPLREPVFLQALQDGKACLGPHLEAAGPIPLGKCMSKFGGDFLEKKTEFARAVANTVLFNHTLSQVGDNAVIYIEEGRYGLQGGVYGAKRTNLTIILDGHLDFGLCAETFDTYCILDKESYPGFSWKPSQAATVRMMRFAEMKNFKLTSNKIGWINGGGEQWYGLFQTLWLGDAGGRTKPIMLEMPPHSDGVEISNIHFWKPAYWTTYLNAHNVHIHHSNVTARKIFPEVTNHTNPIIVAWQWMEELHRVFAFNTDGFDVNGDNVTIHDCVIINSDDCVDNKGGKNWLVENIVASGAGMTLGMAGSAKNVTVRNVVMTEVIHGIYVKDGSATDVLFENVSIHDAYLFGVWVGPAWQETKGSCSLLFPMVPTYLLATMDKWFKTDLDSRCLPPAGQTIRNLTFRNVHIERSRLTPVVFFGGSHEITVDNFTVAGPVSHEAFPWSSTAACYNSSVTLKNTDRALFEECFRTPKDACITNGPRGPFVPCCANVTYSPYGAHWGTCHEHKEADLITV
jgi:hypothetical protein